MAVRFAGNRAVQEKLVELGMQPVAAERGS